jgi:NarL family two-component system response regulator LiaR
MSEAIRVLIADDHAMVRNGLTMFLNSRPDIVVIGQAANGQEAVDLCQTLQPDVILMDLMMPEMDGITATRMIMDTYPQMRVIALTSFKEDKLVFDAVKAGVVGYLLKDSSAAELATTIRDVYEGKMMISLEDMRAALRGAEISPPPSYQLSERERDVLALVVRGLSNRQIAHELTLGESTIKFHVSNILSKLNVPTRAKAVAVAVQHKLVD